MSTSASCRFRAVPTFKFLLAGFALMMVSISWCDAFGALQLTYGDPGERPSTELSSGGVNGVAYAATRPERVAVVAADLMLRAFIARGASARINDLGICRANVLDVDLVIPAHGCSS
jgi:hypothetical protein